ncbi:hypothetical protein GCM10022255_058580 [Dactylosporangium darangshiense]|uniref:Beta-1,3-glucanase n=1 Tax=Dactylosporangium darangshiense TaxID=579108 RepID=A0ABP8DEX2_9ACTN
MRTRLRSRARLRLLATGLAVLGLLVSWAITRVTADAAVPAPAGWNLIFSDDFNGAAGSGVNATNWQYTTGTSYPGGPANFGTHEIETMTASTANVALDGAGNLAITPQRDGAGNWTSGRIETRRADFQPPAGGKLKVEARIQMPNITGAGAAGYWPAFWMLGAPFRGNYWNWPGIGELDIMENVQGMNNEWATMHCGVAPGGPCNEFTGIGGQKACAGSTCQAGFHTYGLEWDRSIQPETIRFYLDGVQFHQVSATNMDAATWANATNHGFFIILNVAMGGDFPAAYGGGPTAATVPGKPMVVDYVAAWQSAGAATPTPTGGTPPPPPSADYTQNVATLNATQAKISFHPTVPSSLVDVHYLVNGVNQQNFRMASNAGTWEQTVSNLSSGTVLEYWFTYEKNGPLYDTPHYTYTHGTPPPPPPTTVATPTFTPPAGAYTSAQSVAISTSTAGATIRYTTDGSTPTAASAQYTGPITLTADTTLKAIAVKSGLTDSAVATGAYTITPVCTGGCGGPGTFPITFQNNTRGTWSNSQIYITMLYVDAGGQWSYLKPNGTGAHLDHTMADAPGHLSKNGVNYPNMSFTVAQAPTTFSPTYVRGGRIYISVGSPVYIPVSVDNMGWGGPDLNNPNDPNKDVYYDWYEYTYVYNQVSYGGNTTAVDQFGLPITSRLVQTSSGYDRTLGISQTRDQVMAGYQAAVGAAFAGLAGQYRIVAPRSASQFKPGGAQAGYLQSYIDQVWNYYTANQWTEVHDGVTFTGRVVNGVLTGTKQGGIPFSVRKPTTTEVFECSGALALGNDQGGTDTIREVGRDFCAAFHRGVALNTAYWYDPTKYYLTSPKDDYSAYFHTIGIDHRAYAFAYDDVNDQSSVQILGNPNPPTSLTLGIGW